MWLFTSYNLGSLLLKENRKKTIISKKPGENPERPPGTMNNESLRWIIRAEGTLNSTLRSRLLAISPELTSLNSSPDLISPHIRYLYIQWFHTYAHFHVAILLEGEKDSKSSLFQPPSASPPTYLSTLEVARSKHLPWWRIFRDFCLLLIVSEVTFYFFLVPVVIC